MNKITKHYLEQFKQFNGNYDEFIATITNDEHRMFIQWSKLRKAAKK